MKQETTVVIVDDHLLIAKAIAGIIDGFKKFRVLYECESGQQLLDKLSFPKNVPHVLLLDISMPDLLDVRFYASIPWRLLSPSSARLHHLSAW